MNDKLIFWAQALDNLSPDHFEIDGKELASDDSVSRELAASFVSQVIKSGIRVFDEDGVQLTACKQYFVLKVFSVQQDCAGRLAPIICHGSYGSDDETATISDTVVDGIDKFARQIGRSLQSGHAELIHKSFTHLKKKSYKKSIVLKALIFAALILSMYLIALFTH